MVLHLRLVCALSVLGLCCVSASYSRLRRAVPDTRLPADLTPTFYNLTLAPLGPAKYKGTVRIYLDVERETDAVVLNIYNKTIITSSMKVILTSQVQKFEITDTLVDGYHDTVTFKLSEPLLKQRGLVLTISYAAHLPSNEDAGFYSVDLPYDENNNTQLLVITQFEPIYARRAFPCFDVPRYRTPFQLSIYRRPGQSSLFNAPLLSSTPTSKGDLVVDVYEATPPIPSYVVAFGVTDFKSLSDGGTVRLFARDTLLGSMSLALSVAQPLLDAMAEYTGVPYAMSKMDMIAERYKGGAMENIGLVTFGESTLRYYEKLDRPQDKFEVVNIIAHEFAHQWFGGAVVMEKWEYLWLNEAFATFFSYKLTEIMYPEWELAKDIARARMVSNILLRDTGKPRAMTSVIRGHYSEEMYFDYVTYDKGGAVLQMTENFLTTKVWKAGLHKYLSEHMFGTVTPEKLFSALQEAAEEIGLYTVNETLQGWTHNPGYPLITVSRDSETSDGKTRYRITQAPYKIRNLTENYTWNVPIKYTTEGAREFEPVKADIHWLYPADPSTSELEVDTKGWILVNIGRIGYYRVNYDPENWLLLKEQLLLNVSSLPKASREQLVDDALNLMESGHLDIDVGLDFLEYLEKEELSSNSKVLQILQSFMSRLRRKRTKESQELLKTLGDLWINLHREEDYFDYY